MPAIPSATGLLLSSTPLGVAPQGTVAADGDAAGSGRGDALDFVSGLRKAIYDINKVIQDTENNRYSIRISPLNVTGNEIEPEAGTISTQASTAVLHAVLNDGDSNIPAQDMAWRRVLGDTVAGTFDPDSAGFEISAAAADGDSLDGQTGKDSPLSGEDLPAVHEAADLGFVAGTAPSSGKQESSLDADGESLDVAQPVLRAATSASSDRAEHAAGVTASNGRSASASTASAQPAWAVGSRAGEIQSDRAGAKDDHSGDAQAGDPGIEIEVAPRRGEAVEQEQSAMERTTAVTGADVAGTTVYGAVTGVATPSTSVSSPAEGGPSVDGENSPGLSTGADRGVIALHSGAGSRMSPRAAGSAEAASKVAAGSVSGPVQQVHRNDVTTHADAETVDDSDNARIARVSVAGGAPAAADSEAAAGVSRIVKRSGVGGPGKTQERPQAQRAASGGYDTGMVGDAGSSGTAAASVAAQGVAHSLADTAIESTPHTENATASAGVTLAPRAAWGGPSRGGEYSYTDDVAHSSAGRFAHANRRSGESPDTQPGAANNGKEPRGNPVPGVLGDAARGAESNASAAIADDLRPAFSGEHNARADQLQPFAHPASAAPQASVQRPAMSAAGAMSALGIPLAGELGRWADEVGERVVWITGRNLQAAEIELDPPELGPLRVHISSHRDGTSVHFSAHSAVARDLVEHSLPRLREMLEASGMNLLDVNVDHQQGGGRRQMPDMQALASVAGGGEGIDEEGANEPGAMRLLQGGLPQGLIDYYA